MTTAPSAGVPHAGDDYLTHGTGLRSWLFSLDHKRIGIMYLGLIVFSLFLGGVFAMVVRFHLWSPAGGLVSNDTYNKMFTLHGAVMIFLFVIPGIPSALGNFVVPLMVGAKDVAFPRVNLLSFNYTSCPRLCGLQLGGLARGLKEAGWAGEAFDVATVSIDPAEKREQMARYKQAMVREAGGGAGVDQGWRFLRGSRADVDALADAVGFRYRYDEKTGEYQHQATLIVVTADGRVSGYLHGITYAPGALRAVVERAASGAVATAEQQRTLGGFLLTCMGFDPADPAPLALKVMRAGGILAMAFLISFLATQAYRDVRRRRTENQTP